MRTWTTDARQGYRTKTIQIGNATVIIHRPELGKDEREAQERQAKQSMEAALKGYLFRTNREAVTHGKI